MADIAYQTAQEEFWAGDFGSNYIDRNDRDRWLAAKTGMFAKVLAKTQGLQSVLEFGPNIGLNLQAIQALLPNVDCTAVEINPTAFEGLKAINTITAHQGSILNWQSEDRFNLTLTSGVLIHIAPDSLTRAYEALYQHSNRYIVLLEYYNPTPISVPYRGHNDRLFKRDFAGEMMDRYDDLKLVDYGFVYHRDPVFPADDATWFLMEKC